MKKGKRETTNIKIFREIENNKYLGILKADSVKQIEMKEKVRKK